MSFFHGVTTTDIKTGARTISLPSSSIIGLCDTFTPGLLGGGTALAGELKLCSGLMKPDTHLGENARHIEVSDDQATSCLFR